MVALTNATYKSFLVIGASLCNFIVCAGEALASDMGPLTTIIQSSSDDSWLVENRRESVLLENRQADGDVIYFYVNENPEHTGRRRVSVDVELTKPQSNPSDSLTITGPDGAKVYHTDSGMYMYSWDRSARDSAQMADVRIATVMLLKDYLLEKFYPYMSRAGFKLTGSFPMPDIVAF